MLVAARPETGRSRPLSAAERAALEAEPDGCSNSSSVRSSSGRSSSPNRIVSTAHQTTLVHDHLPTDDFVAYHEARARGGVGLIVLEATAVHPSGLLTSHTLGGYLPEIADAYRRVAAAVQPHGTRLFVQLLHGGREQIAGPPRPPALAPSAVPSPRFHAEPRALRAAEIEEIVAGYARCCRAGCLGRARRDRDLGRPPLPRRAVPRPGAQPARGRVARRRHVSSPRCSTPFGPPRPGLCVGVRLSADSRACPDDRRARRAGGVDYLSLAWATRPPTSAPPGSCRRRRVDEAAIAGRLTVRSRACRGSRPRGSSTSRRGGAAARRRPSRGGRDDPRADRGSRAAPQGASGRLAEVVRCIGCNACIAHYHAGTPIRCADQPAHRPGAGARRAPAGARSAGGESSSSAAGRPGIAAAVEAGRAGHEVVLLEQSEPTSAGRSRLAGAAPGGRELARDASSTIASAR